MHSVALYDISPTEVHKGILNVAGRVCIKSIVPCQIIWNGFLQSGFNDALKHVERRPSYISTLAHQMMKLNGEYPSSPSFLTWAIHLGHPLLKNTQRITKHFSCCAETGPARAEFRKDSKKIYKYRKDSRNAKQFVCGDDCICSNYPSPSILII